MGILTDARGWLSVNFWSFRSTFGIMHRNLNKVLSVIPNVLRNNPTKVGSARAASSYAEVISKLPMTSVTKLNNGLKVASEETDAEVATVGVFIDTGSRYETEKNNGVGNFLQHLAFQGTKKRTQADLEKEIDLLGAELHAFNSRETTAYYASCLKADVPKIVEILADLTQNFAFGKDEIEKTRHIVLEELEEMSSDYEAVCYDYLHACAFQGTSLAQSIYGPTKNIKNMSHFDLEYFLTNQYAPDRTVLAAAGGVKEAQIAELAQKHFGAKKPASNAEFPPYARFTGSEVRVRDDDLPCAYIAAGVRSCGWSEPDMIPFMLASQLMGEWDKSYASSTVTGLSLAQKAAEYGCMDFYKNFSFNYRDTGLWGVYFAGHALDLSNAMGLIQHEWMQLSETVTDADVDRARNQLLTKLHLESECTATACKDIGRSVLATGTHQSFHVLHNQLKDVNAAKLREVCSKYLYDKCFVQAGVGRIEAMADYGIARNRMYWIRV